MPGVMPFQLICQVCDRLQEFAGEKPPLGWVVLEQQQRGCLVRDYVCGWRCALAWVGRLLVEEAACTG